MSAAVEEEVRNTGRWVKAYNSWQVKWKRCCVASLSPVTVVEGKCSTAGMLARAHAYNKNNAVHGGRRGKWWGRYGIGS